MGVVIHRRKGHMGGLYSIPNDISIQCNYCSIYKLAVTLRTQSHLALL